MQQIGYEVHPVELRVEEENHDPADDDCHSHAIRHTRYEQSEAFELFIERGLDRIVDARGLVDLAVLGMVAYGSDVHHAVAFHHLGAAQEQVGREGGFGIKLRFNHRLVAYRLTGQGGFVDTQRGRFEELTVGRHLVAGVYEDYVAHHYVLFRDLTRTTRAEHLDGIVVVHLIEQRELLVGLILEYESEARGKQDSHKDAHRFEKHRQAVAQTPVFVAGNAYRKHTCYQEDHYKRIGELAQELPPEWFPGRRGENIGAIFSSALLHLLRREALVT